MLDIDDCPKIDFKMKLISKGLNSLIRQLFDSMPGKPSQGKYKDKLRDCLRIVLINLVDTDGYISYSRSDHAPEYTLDRYSASNMRKVTDYLKCKGLIENRPGFFSEDPEHRRISRMRATDKLRALFTKYSIRQSDIKLYRTGDLIELRDALKQPIRFKDNDFTEAAKGNIKKLNELLSGHSIIKPNGNVIHRKALHRIFNIDFNHGGRFYGPEWQNLSGNERLAMQIDRSPVVELDFKAYHPTILYTLNGMQLEGDPYSLPGYSDGIRSFLKRATLILINADDIEAARKAIQGEINAGELKRPREVTDLKQVLIDLANKHEAIENLFRKDTGKMLQRHDSDIAEAVQLQFWQQDIPVLGVHDSFIIEAKYAQKLRCEMHEAFWNKFGAICKITKKRRKK